MRLLHMMRLAQLQHGEVLEELCSRYTRVLEHCPSMIRAPFTTTEDLEAFDSTLNESKTAQLIDELCRLGGYDVGHATRNILCYILTDSLAEQCTAGSARKANENSQCSTSPASFSVRIPYLQMPSPSQCNGLYEQTQKVHSKQGGSGDAYQGMVATC
ncbi:uncharacterized protein LOC135393011 [Ornithodoros turicata]|uniref:uncharacterized protein LOC135393011 n=1 Tax=Ornithodoros turicata TaxID=34597 RepID=UPI00313A0C0A